MDFTEKILWSGSKKLSSASSLKFGVFLDFCKLVGTGILIYIELFLKLMLPTKAKSLDGDVILITGSAGGLGQEIGKQLATSGAKLVLWDVSSQANKIAAETLRNLGAEYVHEDTVDITDREEIVKAAKKVRGDVGNVTILVNNAGVAPVNQFLDLNPAAVRKTFEVNVLSQFWTIQEFLPHMIANQGGHIVTIASTMSHMTMRGSAPYFASKHSVHGLIECLKDELASKGYNHVKFTTAYPFFIKTNLLQDSGLQLKFKFPLITPFLEASYVAEKVVDAIRQEKEFVYLPKTFHIYLAVKPFLPTNLHRAILNFGIEEFYLPPSVAPVEQMEPELEEGPPENNNVSNMEIMESITCGDSHDALLLKNLSFLSPIQKLSRNAEKMD